MRSSERLHGERERSMGVSSMRTIVPETFNCRSLTISFVGDPRHNQRFGKGKGDIVLIRKSRMSPFVIRDLQTNDSWGTFTPSEDEDTIRSEMNIFAHAKCS
jgi:hypothetical protein